MYLSNISTSSIGLVKGVLDNIIMSIRCNAISLLTLIMLRLLSSKAQGRRDL